MDVCCAHCGEPWDTYHLRHDEVHETEGGTAWDTYELDLEDWRARTEKQFPGGRKPPGIGLAQFTEMLKCSEPKPPESEEWTGKLTPYWEAQFGARGWKFANHSLMAILRCPCCPQGEERPDAEEATLKAATVAWLLEGDEDGIESQLAD